MQKNVAGQFWYVFAFDRTDNTAKTGDAANITGDVYLDDGAANAIDDTNPTELAHGLYRFAISQAESNANQILIDPVSATADIQVVGLPGALFTTAPGSNASVAQGADNNTILSSLTIADGAVDAKITYIMDTILTEGGAGRLAAAFIKLLDVTTPVLTAESVNQSADNNTILAHADYGNAKLVRSTTPANTLDVSATGEAGLDFDNVKAASAPTTLTNITVPTVTTTGTASTVTDGAKSATALSTATWTGDRAGYLDELAAANMPADLDAVLEDTGTTIPDTITTAQNDLDKITGSDGATLATAQGNYAPAKAGNEMALIDDAITSAKFDESTAFPVKSADTGSTQIARVGADSDTLETLSDQMDAIKTETASILEDTGTTVPNAIAVVDANVDSILEDTGTTIPAAIATAQDDLDIITGTNGVNLTDDAITALKYDQSTAFPLTSEDSSTAVSAALSQVESSNDIMNLALGLIGDYEIEDGDTSSRQYILCNRFYTRALKKAITSHPWNEAVENVTIVQYATAPIMEFSHKYALPSDCLKVMSIANDLEHWEVRGQYIETDHFRTPDVWITGTDYVAGQYVQVSSVTYLCATSHTSSVWADESAYWTTQGGDYDVVDVTYIKLLTNINLMSTNLIDVIALELAIMVSVGLSGDIKLKTALLEELNKLTLPQARSIDGSEGRIKSIYNSSWKRSRGYQS